MNSSNSQLTRALPETMTSLEIAGVVKSRHSDVKRSIDRLVDRGVIACPPLAHVQEIGGNNRTYETEVYCIGERDSYVIVAQLSPEFTASLVDYWQKHKHQKPVAMPTTAEAFASSTEKGFLKCTISLSQQ